MLVSRISTLLNDFLTINHAKQLHAHIFVNSFDHLEPLLLRQILLSPCGYSKSSSHYAQQILYHLQNPDAFLWGCTVRFLSQHGQYKEAFSHYVQMHGLGLSPSTYALSAAVKACARTVHRIGGISIHTQAYNHGFCSCVYLQTAFVDFYSKLGDVKTAQKVFDQMVVKNVVSWNSILSGQLRSGNLTEAQRVFDSIPKKDVISWNSMISGYAKIGKMEHACSLFQQMPEKNLSSWNALISGYVDSGDMEKAQNFFYSMPQRNNVSCITMIAGYSKCGNVESACELFDRMSKRDLLSFNAMIACYAQNSQPEDALHLFNQMLKPDGNIQPDKMTLSSVISACSQLGDMRFGSWIESYMNKLGIEMDDHLGTAFIDLYAKCGSIDKAYALFHGLKKKDLVAYTAMISGCGINGKVADAIKLFEAMRHAQIRPNLITFTDLLTAYNHAGFVEEGYQCFNSMKDYGLVPSSDHYGIMVDLLGRSGQLEEAHTLIQSMPMQPNAGIWGALLLACSLHNNVELGEIAAKKCFELEPKTTGYRSLLANIYSSVGKWDDALKLRKITEEKRLHKIPGRSWTETP